MAFKDYFRNRRVLVTGDTGFKGSWLCQWLLDLGAEVHGLALPPHTRPALYGLLGLEDQIHHVDVDIRDREALARAVHAVRPQVVFHLAAQAIVRLSYDLPLETIETNVLGTANLLAALEGVGYPPEDPCAAVMITSDKCYENRETFDAYREDEPMGGHDIYSMSKGAAELVIASWRRSFQTRPDGTPAAVRIASCRAGNVIGGGDWAQDRIVVDAIKAITEGIPIPVRNPLSVRPWQHVLEPLSGYLQVAMELGSASDRAAAVSSAWNFGPGNDSERTVGALCDEIVRHWEGASWEQMPGAGARHEARFLKLAVDKARHHLGWLPVWDFERTVRNTVSWYRQVHGADDPSRTAQETTRAQIADYVDAARGRALPWSGA
ncbi:MAG: CDP-glucose 4,6-dehydratase [Pseudomonadota bacterium]